MKGAFAGWLALGLAFFGLSQFTIGEQIRTERAYAAWMAEIENQSQLDTVTYQDARIVYKVAYTLTETAEGDSIPTFSLPGLPAGAEYIFLQKPGGDSALIITYDTALASPVDSATVDAIYAAWGLTAPVAYALTVPGTGTGGLASGDLGTIYSLTVQDSADIALLVGYAYLDSMPFKNYSNIGKYDSLFRGWSDYWWADWTGDSLAMSEWWDNPGINDNTADSLESSCYYILNYHNYYDRAFSHFSYWWRTGDTSYVRKANSYENKYASCLREATRQPNDFIPDGLVIRWIMSKDTLDLKALTKETRVVEEFFARRNWWGNAADCTNCDDARVQARTYLGIQLANRFGYPDTAAYAPTWALADSFAKDSMWQWIQVGSDSAYLSGFFPLRSYCDGMVGWQMGTQFSHAMIRDWEFETDSAKRDSIETLIVRLADTLWTLAWVGVDPVGKAQLDSFNVIYAVGMDTTLSNVMLHHDPADSTAKWWAKYYDSTTVSNWALYSGTKYKARLTVDPAGIALNRVLLTEGSDTSSLADLEWKWLSDTLYIRRDAGSPSTELVQRIAALTPAAATDSFWVKHISLRDSYNGGHDSVPVYGRQYDLTCHFGYGLAAHSTTSSHVISAYSPGALLTGMIAPIYAFAWKITGDSTYWHQADTLLSGIYYSEKRSWAAWPYNNGKLYNEAYYQTQRAIKWLDEG